MKKQFLIKQNESTCGDEDGNGENLRKIQKLITINNHELQILIYPKIYF